MIPVNITPEITIPIATPFSKLNPIPRIRNPKRIVKIGKELARGAEIDMLPIEKAL